MELILENNFLENFQTW